MLPGNMTYALYDKIGNCHSLSWSSIMLSTCTDAVNAGFKLLFFDSLCTILVEQHVIHHVGVILNFSMRFCLCPDEGGVFRSKRTTRYTANEIQDSWETKTDLPVDHRRAEEVQVYSNVHNDAVDDGDVCFTLRLAFSAEHRLMTDRQTHDYSTALAWRRAVKTTCFTNLSHVGFILTIVFTDLISDRLFSSQRFFTYCSFHYFTDHFVWSRYCSRSAVCVFEVTFDLDFWHVDSPSLHLGQFVGQCQVQTSK